MTEQVQLFRKNSLGIGTWRIWRDGAVLRYAHAVVEGAAEIQHEDLIKLNGSGRNLDQQIELEMNSRISRMLDKGYKYLRTEALAGATNQMGFRMPMLAQTFDTSMHIEFETAYLQPKLNGHRCLITNFEGELVAYTRKGKPITTINHILQDLTWIPEGWTIDGELYIHGRSLQSISSLIKRDQPDSKLLRFHWYDYMSSEPFSIRLDCMRAVGCEKPMRHVDLVETVKVNDVEHVFYMFRKYRANGYEGAMIRHSLAGYEDGKRSYQLLKVKEWHDCEVLVIGARPSKEGWAILQVKYQEDGTNANNGHLPKDGVLFDISAPGTHAEKTEVLVNFEKYRHRKLRIEYAEITADGIPFHASAIGWHEEL
jgi:DNA ligase-1